MWKDYGNNNLIELIKTKIKGFVTPLYIYYGSY